MKYIHHLKLIITMSFQTAAAYRVDFILRIIRSFLEITSAWIVIHTYFSYNTNISGWTQDQALLVMSIALFIGSLVMFLWGNGLENLHREITNGTLDRLLLQPMDSQWLASTRVMYTTNLFRIVFNFAFFAYVISRLTITINLFGLILFILNLISSLVIYYSIMFAASVISFWSFSGQLFYLFNSLTSIVRYPLDIFNQGIKLVLTIFPLVFIATIPAAVLLDRFNLLAYVSPLIAFLSLLLVRFFWFLGLKHYESASY